VDVRTPRHVRWCVAHLARTSYSFTTKLCLTIFMMEISFLICAPMFCFWIFSLSKILMATCCPVSVLVASFTLPKEPCPRVVPISYLPTRFTMVSINEIHAHETTSRQRNGRVGGWGVHGDVGCLCSDAVRRFHRAESGNPLRKAALTCSNSDIC